MAVSEKTRRILMARAGGVCSMPDCRCDVIQEVEGKDRFVITGEVAHIVAQEPGGPRGSHPYDRSVIDEYDNLILLCEKHHKIVDSSPEQYPVERLRQIKLDHEEWVASTRSRQERFTGINQPSALVSETVRSTLLPVSNIPLSVFLAPCDFSEGDIKVLMAFPSDSKVMFPFLVREKKLITFFDTRKGEGNPFAKIVDPYTAEKHDAVSWWDDPDLYRWYIALLNRSLNKLTGRRGLLLDKDHGRYYFPPCRQSENDEPIARKVRYKALMGSWVDRQVAWRPTFRYKDGDKNYWEHFAVSLYFHRVDKLSWCLSLRPERRFTRDGFTPLTPKGIGRRSASVHSRQYNIDVLTEVHFWREYLSDNSPRIIMPFGYQALVVENEMIDADIEWPGVPGDVKQVTNIRHDEDLFSLAEFEEAMEEEGFDEEIEWGEDAFDET